MSRHSPFIFPHFKKFLAVFLLCLMTTVQQAQASKTPYVLGGSLIAMALFMGFGLYHESSYSSEPFDKSMELLPKITYEIDGSKSHKHGATKVVLKPKIVRGKYLKPQRGERRVNDFVQRAVCNPISQIKNPGLNLLTISEQCDAWFKTHTMKFPHQALEVTVDKLDTLLLPELVFDVNTQKLELIAAHISYVDGKNAPSSAESEITNKKDIHWEQLAPSFPELNNLHDLHQHPFELCHHVPERARMQEPHYGSNGLAYYQFPMPGISHMHRSELEFYIVSMEKKGKFTGYYWVIDAPWPNGYQTLEFIGEPTGTKTSMH